MKVRINKGMARGRIEAPPSKSMAHRLLICAGLSEGECTVHGISESEDVLATLDCLDAIGAKWKRNKDAITVTGTDIRKIPAGKITPNAEKAAALSGFSYPYVSFPVPMRCFQEAAGLWKDPLAFMRLSAGTGNDFFER